MKTCLLCEASSLGTAVTFKRRNICTWCDEDLERRTLRFCTLCHSTFPLAEVVPSYPTRCAACRAERRRTRYEASRQTEIAASRRWHAAHPGATATRKRQRYTTDAAYRAACYARKRAWYEQNRERAIAYAKEYTDRNQEAAQRWQRSGRERRLAYLRTYHQRRKLAVWRGLV